MTKDQIFHRIQSTYPEAQIEVFDMTGTENHYQVFIESSHFKQLSRIEQHQSIMKLFNPELQTGELHALSLKTQIKK